MLFFLFLALRFSLCGVAAAAPSNYRAPDHSLLDLALWIPVQVVLRTVPTGPGASLSSFESHPTFCLRWTAGCCSLHLVQCWLLDCLGDQQFSIDVCLQETDLILCFMLVVLTTYIIHFALSVGQREDDNIKHSFFRFSHGLPKAQRYHVVVSLHETKTATFAEYVVYALHALMRMDAAREASRYDAGVQPSCHLSMPTGKQVDVNPKNQAGFAGNHSVIRKFTTALADQTTGPNFRRAEHPTFSSSRSPSPSPVTFSSMRALLLLSPAHNPQAPSQSLLRYYYSCAGATSHKRWRGGGEGQREAERGRRGKQEAAQGEARARGRRLTWGATGRSCACATTTGSREELRLRDGDGEPEGAAPARRSTRGGGGARPRRELPSRPTVGETESHLPVFTVFLPAFPLYCFSSRRASRFPLYCFSSRRTMLRLGPPRSASGRPDPLRAAQIHLWPLQTAHPRAAWDRLTPPATAWDRPAPARRSAA